MRIFTLLPLLLIFISCSSAKKHTPTGAMKSITEETFASRADLIDSLFHQYDNTSPGAAITIVQNGKILYTKAYGLSNMEYGTPNTRNTIFHLASVSKQFTAFAIATLEDQKKLSLDDDIRKYLPAIPDYGEVITIKDLIHHTSGLKDQWSLMAIAGWRNDDVFDDHQVMEIIKSQKSLNFKPGEKFSYSNTNYTLLAKIVEVITKETFAEWTSKNIFIPLKMNNTQFYNDHTEIVRNRAYSYEKKDGKYQKKHLNFSTVGPSSLFSSAEDLALWLVNFQFPIVGNEGIMQRMMEVSKLGQNEEASYAFGQGLKKYKNMELVFHDGADAGYRSYLARFPDQHLGIAILGNLDSLPVENLAMEIADLFLENQLFTDIEDNDEEKEMIPLTSKDFRNTQLNLYEGSYSIAPNMALRIWLEKSVLKGQITGKQSIHKLEQTSQHEFLISTLNIGLTFNPNEQGDIQNVKLNMKTEGRNLIAKKVMESNPEDINIQELKGSYFSPELSSLYTLEIVNGQLYAKNKRLEDIHLKPITVDFFSGSQWFIKEVKIVRDSDNEISGINISSNRAKNIYFKKVS